MAAMVFCMVCVLSACKKQKDDTITPPLNDNSLPSGAIANIILKQKSGNSIQFELDVAVFRDSKNLENSLSASNFIIDTLYSGGTYIFKSDGVSLSNPGNATLYSALMLMDQSGSIASTDPSDYRLDAANAFCSNLETGSNIMLWSFTSSYSNNYQMYGTGFTTDTAAVLAQIENLRNREGGGTPLYVSQVAATNFCAANATNAGKAVLTFTDGEDTDGGSTADGVSDNAVAKGVRLYNIGLGGAQTSLLCREAIPSGGAFMFAQDARQLISIFGNLGKLLDNSARYYHTTWTVTRNNAFTSGSISHIMRVVLPYGGEVSIPFTLDY